MNGSRAPYTHDELRRLLHPRSIAVIGASTRAGSFGLRTIRNLAGFDGAVYPVNARYDAVEGHRCYPDLAALPQAPDCAVIALNREAVKETIAQCVARGVGGIVLYASGYAETGRPELIQLQDQLLRLVEGTPTRLIGPNCLGINNYAIGARIMFGRMPKPRPLHHGAIGIVTQSGSVGMSLAQAMERGVPISHSIPVGNGADVGIADLIAYLAADEHCQAIVTVFEGVEDPRQLVQAAELAVSADKPLLVHKMAVGKQGAAAALSHTGALAGSHASFRAVLERAGAVMVDDLDDVMETAQFFAKAGRPTGRGVGIVLGSGGIGVAAADKAEEHGVALPQPEGATLETLKRHVPEFGALRNPCDVTAMTLNDDTAFEACCDAFLSDPAYSALLVVYPYADEFGTSRVPVWRRLAERHGKPVVNYWASEWLEGIGAEMLEAEPRIATFRSLRRLFRAVRAWHDLEAHRALPAAARLSSPDAAGQASAALAVAPSRTLTEREAKAALAPYGIPVVREILVQDAAAAAEAAAELGFPVAIKVESADIPHKTEAGVIRLNLRDAAEVAAGYDAIMAKARAVTPPTRISGVLVQPMVPQGIEIVAGVTNDHAFGPLVAFGFGGIFVELLKDTALLPAPFTPAEAEMALRNLRGASLLDGFRGLPAVSVAALAQVLARLSEFAADLSTTIAEVDVNPLICAGDRIVAVDALIVRRA
ncbi:acetate--CoA ligase family protein [Falsiroseomonas sp. HW251]|uniref:acetate--CoA ligase family protein n=1 Tax=Falsiroseomonas sp. HW251 TaxID=3390998 RepID=UPI003D3182E2